MTIRERLQQIKIPKNRRAFTIIIILFIFMQLSGLNTIIFYMEIIVRKGMVTSIAPSSVVMIVNSIGMRLISLSIMLLLSLFYITLLIHRIRVYVFKTIWSFLKLNLATCIYHNIYTNLLNFIFIDFKIRVKWFLSNYDTGIIFGWCGAYAIDFYGRRILLAISSSGVIVGTLSLGLHFLLLDLDYDPSDLEWFLNLSLIIFMLVCFGLVPVPSTMLSELFPADLKSVAGFIASITSAIFAFICTKSYQPIINIIGEQYMFWIYAAIITICLLYSVTLMPETKGKTLQVNLSHMIIHYDSICVCIILLGHINNN